MYILLFETLGPIYKKFSLIYNKEFTAVIIPMLELVLGFSYATLRRNYHGERL